MSTPSDRQPDNRRLRYSLRTLMLLTAFLAMALAIVVLTRELIPLRAEVQQLRNEAGYLTIDDPTKIHAIGIDTDSPLLWKWKVYFPRGDRFCGANAIVGDLPPAGEEPDRTGGMWLGNNERLEGTVIVQVYKDLQHKWMLQTTLQCGGNTSATKSELSDAQLNQLKNGWGSWHQVGAWTAAGEPDRPFILLRKRFSDTDRYADIDSPGPGVLIWLNHSPRDP